MDEGDDLSDFLSLLEEDCGTEAAKPSSEIAPPAPVAKPASSSGYREITDPDAFLRPSEDGGPSQVHGGDTDSSDDEDNRNFQEQNLTTFGRDVKKLMHAREETAESNKKSFSLSGLKGVGTKTEQNDPKVSWSRNQAVAPTNQQNLRQAKTVSGLSGLPMKAADRDCFLEPISGIRVVNPLVTQEFILERSDGRQTVSCSMVKRKYESNSIQNDWLTTGVIVSSMKKVSQKSKEYLVWTISDLKQDMATVTVFLFSSANTTFTTAKKGTVVGILSPNILPPNSAKFDLILTVNDAQRILIIGTSKDYGVCKSQTAKNEPCSNFVNTNVCPYCTYHLSKEYKRHSGKPTAPHSALMNKVLGKSEVFYGGKSYSAIKQPPKKIPREHLSQLALPQPTNKKIKARDHLRMQSLLAEGQEMPNTSSVISVSPLSLKPKNITRMHHIMNNTRKATVLSGDKQPTQQGSVSKLAGVLGKNQSKISESSAPKPSLSKAAPKQTATASSRNVQSAKSLLSTLTDSKKESSLSKPSAMTPPPTKKVDLSNLGGSNGRPTLSKFNSIDLGDLCRKPVLHDQDRAKVAALQLVRAKGPFKKENPNKVKKAASAAKVNASLKRKVPVEDDEEEAKLRAEFELKKPKFLAMIETGSQHQDLVESAHQEAEDNYFNNMETKEKIEDKMLNTHKVEVKAIKCTLCNYLSLARSDFCRKQGHPVKLVQTHKRFFQCKGCKNHIWVLELVPTSACSNCGQSHWERAGMIKDKQAKFETLRISAGDRETFNPANMNSLVPD
ncbi:protein MCM10 homolog [Neocloeon triangulifer]|uniref:protein MCM10 homolog n=1 Tax=Neocloeon triangulifer TaxID=2078957 RepID=UPI00286F6323|nr:protein MCM10 homolog [Neocloeon triangulifer]